MMGIPRSWLSWDFALFDNDSRLADIDMSAWREKGVLTVSGRTYRVYREGLLSGAFILESDGTVLARAEKPSAWASRMIIEAGGRRLELRRPSMWLRKFQLIADGAVLGTLYPANVLSRRMQIELPQDMSLPLRTFVVWLTLLMWKRESDAAVVSS